MTFDQGGITCEAIDEPGKSSKAIDKRVIINFRDKNVVIARFCDKNEVFVLFIDIYIYIYRLDICQNIYMTRVWGKKFYTLKVRKF